MQICDDMETQHTALLYYCETRWLAGAKALHRVLEMKNEITIL
jgi:hypothetical protein